MFVCRSSRLKSKIKYYDNKTNVLGNNLNIVI